MQDFLTTLLTAVITAAVPVITAFIVTFIRKSAAKVSTETEDTKVQGYIAEIADAVSIAVAATSQTYVDALKSSGSFTAEAQKEAARKAFAACVAATSPAAQKFIESAYGDLTEYLTTKIEAEVRKQKVADGLPGTTAASTKAEANAVAASTAAATAATIAQTAIQQMSAETAVPEGTV